MAEVLETKVDEEMYALGWINCRHLKESYRRKSNKEIIAELEIYSVRYDIKGRQVYVRQDEVARVIRRGL